MEKKDISIGMHVRIKSNFPNTERRFSSCSAMYEMCDKVYQIEEYSKLHENAVKICGFTWDIKDLYISNDIPKIKSKIIHFDINDLQ